MHTAPSFLTSLLSSSIESLDYHFYRLFFQINMSCKFVKHWFSLYESVEFNLAQSYIQDPLISDSSIFLQILYTK